MKKRKIDCILEGIAIIRKYDPDEWLIQPAHDTIYAGNYELTYAQMTEDEHKLMAALGWFEDEGSWAIYT